MRTDDMSFPSELIAKIVHCVEDAVGDDILADIQYHDLRTTVSSPSRIWDFLNTNLVKNLEMENCTIAKAQRGFWQMIILYEKTTQCIFTFMREKRFAELRRCQRYRAHMHYLDMVAMQFNKELLADQQQLTFFPHVFSDENMLAERVQALLHDLGDEIPVVRNHVLVLFDTAGYQLTHIRAVMVTPSLDIAQNASQDWSQYISDNISSVVEKVTHPDAPENQPNKGLKLKTKAIERKRDKPQKKGVQATELES